ncbi:DUF945 domain-containing protein [Colwellia sp. Arc7-635]|uniref:YdgA family protein n=1 Tax=Colwellia sp. Arc7-635 TaxID=2497879 RepID=UPI000F856D5F|nr:YdgA family protein [Colwellia sp. Arc7-635]AZQ85784.1 DUF945 domain-containing protein [Colwellia sp. Arc7-635]
MKKVVIALGAIVCVGLVGPKVIGSIVEQKYDDIASRFVDHPSIEIVERSFTTHWFSGQSVTKMKIKGVAAEIEDFQLIVNEQLTFGPVIFADNSVNFALAHSNANLDFDVSSLDQEAQNDITEFTDQLNEKLTISSIITYGLNYTTQVMMAATTFEEDGNTIDIGALDSEFTLEDDKYISGYLNWSGLDFKGPEANVQLSPLESTFSQEIIDGDIYSGNGLSIGDFSMLIKSISAQDNQGNDLLSIENLTLSADSQIEDELMNIGVKYGADRFKGAGQELEKLNLDISFNRLDPKVLMEINDWATKMQQDPENFEHYNQQLMTVATKLLTKDPELNINDFSVLTSEGAIKSDLQLMVDHTRYDQANPMSIMAALKADAKGVAPLPFFQKMGLEGMINMYIEQGFIIKKEAELSFAAQFAQGQLTVNGQAIAL